MLNVNEVVFKFKAVNVSSLDHSLSCYCYLCLVKALTPSTFLLIFKDAYISSCILEVFELPTNIQIC